MSARVTVALGSNLGDRLARLREGVRALAPAGVTVQSASSVYEGAAQEVVGPEPDFLNAVVIGTTEVAPRELLARLLAVEAQAGRERSYRGAPRTLDLDLLFYGRRTVSEPGLEVPHPRWRERSFVLAPLAEIDPERLDPETGLTVHEMWRHRKAELPPVRAVASPGALWGPGPGTEDRKRSPNPVPENRSEENP